MEETHKGYSNPTMQTDMIFINCTALQFLAPINIEKIGVTLCDLNGGAIV